MDFAVVIDEGQVLTLFIRVRFHSYDSKTFGGTVVDYAARWELPASSAARVQGNSSSMRLMG